MSTEELINLCQAVKHGAMRQVTNHKSGKEGIVVDVTENKLVVQVENASEVWAYEDCK
jgi:RNase P/RNase MRP subunit p29